jgi:hypothetical protein
MTDAEFRLRIARVALERYPARTAKYLRELLNETFDPRLRHRVNAILLFIAGQKSAGRRPTARLKAHSIMRNAGGDVCDHGCAFGQRSGTRISEGPQVLVIGNAVAEVVAHDLISPTDRQHVALYPHEANPA